MATVGQIVYNLQDYHTSGGLISTSNSGSGIISSTDGGYSSGKINLFSSSSDLVSRYTSTGFTKVGIQAPAGTKVMLNGNKEILIGRTGIYEVDDDITITSMYFIRPKKYVKDDEATEEKRKEAIGGGSLPDADSSVKSYTEGFLDAEYAREQAIEELDQRVANGEFTSDSDSYWNEYSKIQDIYDEAYAVALACFT